MDRKNGNLTLDPIPWPHPIRTTDIDSFHCVCVMWGPLL